MINVSREFKQVLEKNRKFYTYADIVLADETELRLDNDRIMTGGLRIEDAVSSDDSFDIGAAIINKCTVKINNIDEAFSPYDFTGAEVTAYVGLKLADNRIEKIRKGTYAVDEAKYNGSTIALSCLDNMRKFDKPYSLSRLVYPATLGEIVRDACSVCEVYLQTQTFPHHNFVIQSRPADEAATFREAISWAAQIACCFCRCDVYGRLELKWYDVQALERASLDGGSFKPWTGGDTIDGGTFKPWTGGTVYDGGTFGDRDNIHHIYSSFSVDIATDDVVITGVRVLEKTKEDDKDAIVTYQSGTDGYVLSVENNDLIQGGAGQEIADWLGEQLIGLRFRPASVTHLSDPTIEGGDVGFLTDRKGRTYRIVVSNTHFTAGDSQSTSCNAKTPARNSATRYSAETKAYVENRKNFEKERTDRQLALENLAGLLSSSPGMYATEDPPGDPNAVRYLHDKPTVAESKNVIKFTSEAIGISNDGGKTYPYGLILTGDAILNKIYAIGIDAGYIKAGILSVGDTGEETLYVNFRTKEVRIRPETFSLASGKTIDSIAQEKADAAQRNAQAQAGKALNDFVSTVYDPKIASLQSQIDGQIETWYYDYQPALSNAPASSWKTEADKVKHEGDLFYWKSKGYSYRFLKEGNAWKWQIITDSDITKALSDAAKAQDTADNKRRIFVTQPKPPYDKGDLWTQGANGDIKVCNAARASGNYSASDWGLASKYIDQVEADKAASDAVKKQTQTDILNRLTNNGADKGIYLLDGKLYISFSAARGGTLTLGGADNVNGKITLLDSYGNKIGEMGNAGVDFTTGSFSTSERVGSPAYTAKTQITGSSLKYFSDNVKTSEISPLANFQNSFWSGHYENNMITIASNKGIALKRSAEKEGSGSVNKLSMVINPNGSGSVDIYDKITIMNGRSLEWSNYGSNSGSSINPTNGGLSVSGSFSVTGTKSRVSGTKNYGDRLLYCYEMPSPMFGDIGEAMTDENGECCIFLDDVFSETIEDGIEYQVFLQKEGKGDLWVEHKEPGYFIVKGAEKLKFAWEIKCKQKEYGAERLERHNNTLDINEPIDYFSGYEAEKKQLIREREDLLYETA